MIQIIIIQMCKHFIKPKKIQQISHYIHSKKELAQKPPRFLGMDNNNNC